MEIQKIYFDMDDTIADFSRGILEICGFEPVAQDKSTPEYDDKMWGAIKAAGHFYARLEEVEPGMKLFKRLRDQYGDKVEILTAVPKAHRGIVTAESDKRSWIDEHIGKEVVLNIAHAADDKKDYAKNAGCILIDDLKKNIDMWRCAGGTGIHFLKDDAEYTSDEIKNSALD